MLPEYPPMTVTTAAELEALVRAIRLPEPHYLEITSTPPCRTEHTLRWSDLINPVEYPDQRTTLTLGFVRQPREGEDTDNVLRLGISLLNAATNEPFEIDRRTMVTHRMFHELAAHINGGLRRREVMDVRVGYIEFVKRGSPDVWRIDAGLSAYEQGLLDEPDYRIWITSKSN